MKKTRNRKKAFTLIELLVVIAIIASLVAILSVGLRKVKMIATNLKQKGEFHGMEVSLALFQNDFDNFPDSALVNGGSDYVCGAQRLAEALEGRDQQGFHPKSKWHPDLEPASPDNYYNQKTLKERKPVYFELKHSDLYTLDDMWGVGNASPLQEDECPVITDVFVRNRVTTVTGETKKIGSPVLYFKAAPTKRFRMNSSNEPVNPATSTEYTQWVYNFDDNIDLLNLPWLREPESDTDNDIPPHYQDPDDASKTEEQFFYETITQREDDVDNDGTMDYFKPYNKDRFILISAGWDGIFGTKDDLTNYNY